MKKIITIIVLFTANLILAQSNFSRGFSDGYKNGYCQNQGIGCISPLPLTAPIPNVTENINSYQDGYNRGFTNGLNSQKSSNSNSDRQRYQTSEAKYVENKMYSGPSSGGNNSQDIFTFLLLSPYYIITETREFNISAVYSLTKPNDKMFENGYGIEFTGRFGKNKTEFIYGYSFIKYNSYTDKILNYGQHACNIGVAFNLVDNNKIYLELAPLVEYELNKENDFGFGGYISGSKRLSKSINLTLKYKYTTVANQIALGVTF